MPDQRAFHWLARSEASLRKKAYSVEQIRLDWGEEG
jgi:hypothetical protein